MTLEAVQQLLVEIVTEHKPFSRYREGILGATLGYELVKRDAKDIHLQFGFRKLGDFVRARCQPPLVVTRLPSVIDFLVDVTGRTPSESPKPRPAAPATSRARVEPRVWAATLTPRAPSTFIAPDGRVTTSEISFPNAENWCQIKFMPTAEQGAVLERLRPRVIEMLPDAEVRTSILSAIERAKNQESPILALSATMTALYRLSVSWNVQRIETVFKFVVDTTGIELKRVSSLVADVPQAASYSKVEPVPQPAPSNTPRPPQGVGVEQAKEASEPSALREIVKRAIDFMSDRELHALELPAGAMFSAITATRDNN